MHIRNDIWIYDLQSGGLAILTTTGNACCPKWDRSGKYVFFVTEADGNRIQHQPSDRSDTAKVFTEGSARARPDVWEVSLGPPGGYSVIREDEPANGSSLFLIKTDSPLVVRPFVDTPANEFGPAVSPDGRLVAYTSDESGRYEIYVRPLPGPGGQLQVSTSGGREPLWLPNTRELVYRTGTHLMSATLAGGMDLAVIKRDSLFRDTYQPFPFIGGYDVLPSGEFVMVQREGASGACLGACGSGKLFVVLNWLAALQQQ